MPRPGRRDEQGSHWALPGGHHTTAPGPRAVWLSAALLALVVLPSLLVLPSSAALAVAAAGGGWTDLGAISLQAAIRSIAAGTGPSVGVASCHSGSGGTAACAAVTATAYPSGQVAAKMVWDARDGRVVLFGGCKAPCSVTNPGSSETWTFRAGNWTQLHPVVHPSARWDPGMAYDSVARQVVLFGGWNATIYFNDTWTFYGGAWHLLTPTVAPAARRPGLMVYDVRARFTVLFGGTGGGGGTQYNDTWTFSGGNWTLLTTPVAPSPRRLVMGDYDGNSGFVVLFGGYDASAGSFLNDTWQFAAGNWTRLTTPVAPSPRGAGALAYDSRAQAILLFGGSSYSGNFGDTWRFTLGAWKLLHPPASPAARSGAAAAYDHRDGYFVIFGGQSCSFGTQCAWSYTTTWAFAAGNWTKV